MQESRLENALFEMRQHQRRLEKAVQNLIDRTWQLREGKRPQLLKDKRFTPDQVENALDQHVFSDTVIKDIKAVIGFERDWVQTWASVYLVEADAARHRVQRST